MSSGTSSAPASTIVRPSFVPTTIRSSDVSTQFCCSVGLMTNSPSIRPIRASHCGGEHHRLATADDDCAVRLLRELAGLKGDLLRPNLDGDLSPTLGRDTHSIVLHSSVLMEGGSLNQLLERAHSNLRPPGRHTGASGVGRAP